ncbi:MAG: PAS domain S-box protein, partial [Cytophagaceae bacterium]
MLFVRHFFHESKLLPVDDSIVHIGINVPKLRRLWLGSRFERRFVYANRAMLALFGLSSDEMLGKTFADLAYPEDLAARLNAHIDVILRT